MNYRIAIKNAEYIDRYIIKFDFNDGHEQFVDFESYLKSQNHPQVKRYWDINNFKNFRIDNADIVVWGKNWDLCFDVSNLYNNDLTNYFDNYERGRDQIIVL